MPEEVPVGARPPIVPQIEIFPGATQKGLRLVASRGCGASALRSRGKV